MNEEIVTRSKSDTVQSLNKAEFVGSVVHKYRPNKDIITLTLAVGRVNEANVVDYPNVTFYGDNAEAIDNAINIMDGEYPRVCVVAEIQTNRKERDGKAQYFQDIVGVELRKAPTNMERITGSKGVGAHKLPPINEVCLQGEVINIYQITRADRDRPIGTILTIKTRDGSRVNFPKATCFGANSGTASKLNVGDAVCLTGSVQTRFNKEARRRYETVVCNEISKIDT